MLCILNLLNLAGMLTECGEFVSHPGSNENLCESSSLKMAAAYIRCHLLLHQHWKHKHWLNHVARRKAFYRGYSDVFVIWSECSSGDVLCLCKTVRPMVNAAK